MAIGGVQFLLPGEGYAWVFTFSPGTNQDESPPIISVGVFLFSPCIMLAWFCVYVCVLGSIRYCIYALL